MASGDIAWIITATALVMLMTPALGFFYGGLVRKKNLVSTIIQCFVIFAVDHHPGDTTFVHKTQDKFTEGRPVENFELPD